MIKIQQKPKSFDAIQWTENNLLDVLEFLNIVPDVKWPWDEYVKMTKENGLRIPNPEFKLIANLNDWIIKAENMEFITCSPEMFNQIYQEVI